MANKSGRDCVCPSSPVATTFYTLKKKFQLVGILSRYIMEGGGHNIVGLALVNQAVVL
jgi:hypothetical protein